MKTYVPKANLPDYGDQMAVFVHPINEFKNL